MEKKIVEVKNYVTTYVAADGTEFNDAQECAKYEKSMMCMLMSRLEDMNPLRKGTEYNLYGTGSDENKGFVVVPKDSTDIDRLKQILGACGGYGVECAKDDLIGQPAVLVIGYDNEWAQLQGLADIVKNMTDGKWTITKVEESKK